MSRIADRGVLEAVRTEGGLLPADVLVRVASGDAKVGGVAPGDYHLDENATLPEAITRSWNRLLGSWASFRERREKLPEGDAAVALTRDRWLLPLFQELGYGRVPKAGGDAVRVGNQSYAISHHWHRSPLHLLGAGVPLDKRSPGVTGASTASPHGLVQDFLNRSDSHLWGFVSNGVVLRVLRDHRSLTRSAYVEWDLESIFDGELFHAFRLLWLVCHQSRLEAEKPEECWLEKWHLVAQEDGVAALGDLKRGVKEAIEQLGGGFLRHTANTALRDMLAAGTLDKQDYYRELLRLVYRLIFLFVTEDRDVLLDPGAPPEARSRYARFYSTRRLRDLARKRRGSAHSDLWHGLRVVMRGLDDGLPPIGLPALGSFLWSPTCAPHLEAAEISNEDLLTAVRELSTTKDSRGHRYPVSWRMIGAEELGGVYEGLLELHPDIDRSASKLDLRTAAGHERKTTGSYYTPSSLVECLLDTALEPVVDDALKGKSGKAAENAILELTVCDPACGSGHFLLAAARRLARRLARVCSGDEEPSPEATRNALRQVVGKCLYGVDLNPMAAELCKVSLWLEGVEPGRPLSFLEGHIQVGNSLLGTTKELDIEEIPEIAFDELEGDDPKVARDLKARNKLERTSGQTTMFARFADATADSAAQSAVDVAAVEAVPDLTRADVRRKETDWQRHLASPTFQHARLVADVWCSAFFWRKQRGRLQDAAPTHGTYLEIRRDPARHQPTVDEARMLGGRYGFFHWHLMFPRVFERGGFDLMLGNPPWDTLSPDAKEFFSAFDPTVRDLDKAGQTALIAGLVQREEIADRWATHRRDLYATVHFLKHAGRFVLYARGNLGKGDFNVYRMFVEAAVDLARSGGSAAQLTPEGLYNGANCQAIREHLFTKCSLTELVAFENTNGIWFPGVHTAMKFCLYAARPGGSTVAFAAAFNIRSPADLTFRRTSVMLSIPISIIREFSPDALAIMEFTSQRDIDITAKMYSRWPKFGDETAGPPFREYMAEVHMGNDRDRFSAKRSGLPLYEGRMVSQYDHRAKGYRSGHGRKADWEDLPFDSRTKSIQPQWYVPVSKIPDKLGDRFRRYRIGFCDVASPTNERSLVAALLPPEVLSGDKVPTITFGDADWYSVPWLALANSFAMDFVARKKISLKMSYTVMDSLPFPRSTPDERWVQSVAPRVLRLTCTGPEMTAYWNDMSKLGWVKRVPDDAVPGCLDDDERLQLRAEIDAIVARDVYGLTTADMEYILGTFPTVEKYERKAYGEFRTRRLVLDALQDTRHGTGLEGA